MRHVRTSTALAALALALAPGVAQAHEGDHPFATCSEAYANGYANIAEGDEHYGSHLDRDQDGIGCDQPPADFEPVADGAGAENTADDSTDDSTDLAATGGNGATPYLAGGGAVVLLAGGGVLLAVRRRRADVR
ncbi:putative secreted protein [Streptomyces davaonensis JCM 4913]|uniref:Putative secreted protein n=1 Tax=Streptomyces davaonensis (strain DSM 101723 / JCM 4913 / KCC S-0913 / 768) TaxID=1214101 RepID=K4RA16_STRDJ|nr:excalibur calcium-binding domain-containing protein [Streptomyces davaonensis]CCK30208.1 putative secreted protein [Streptomyces davaonensis JCM 4913]